MEKQQGRYQLKIESSGNGKDGYICFSLNRKSFVVLKVTTPELHELRLLVNEELPEGPHRFFFETGNLYQPEYVIRLFVNNETSIDIEHLNFKNI
jgi:hypothetical protein